MTEEAYRVLVLVLLLLGWLLDLAVELLNLKAVKESVPEEFRELYDADRYAKAQRYLRERTRYGMVKSCIALPVIVLFILLGGFGAVDAAARSAGFGIYGTGLLFMGILVILGQLLDLPFSIYSTFVIEERYGFNRTTVRTFVLDLFKGLLLMAVLGGPLFAAVLWFFDWAGTTGWLYAWGLVTLVQLVLTVVAPVWIMPLFNKFQPLPDGELKTAVEDYAREQGFALKGLFSMDGSRRSTRANAYFTGLGRWRRVVFYDTLIEKHTVPELVGILAHEVGHWRRRHIPKMLFSSMASTGIMLFILSMFLRDQALYEAFGCSAAEVNGTFPIYAGFAFFGFLYSPISLLLGVLFNALSRGWEYEADAFAADTAGDTEAFIEGLKKLTVDNLGNLYPHPFKVFMEYSHPPVMERIRALRNRTA